jgi:hypothetical protein
VIRSMAGRIPGGAAGPTCPGLEAIRKQADHRISLGNLQDEPNDATPVKPSLDIPVTVATSPFHMDTILVASQLVRSGLWQSQFSPHMRQDAMDRGKGLFEGFPLQIRQFRGLDVVARLDAFLDTAQLLDQREVDLELVRLPRVRVELPWKVTLFVQVLKPLHRTGLADAVTQGHETSEVDKRRQSSRLEVELVDVGAALFDDRIAENGNRRRIVQAILAETPQESIPPTGHLGDVTPQFFSE